MPENVQESTVYLRMFKNPSPVFARAMVRVVRATVITFKTKQKIFNYVAKILLGLGLGL